MKLRTGGQRQRRKETLSGYFLHSLGLHGGQRPTHTAWLRFFILAMMSLALSFLWYSLREGCINS